LNWINETLQGTRGLEAQPRYRAKAEPCQVAALENDKARVIFLRPQRAISPGQICAFYEGGRLLGSGVFETTLTAD
jgi:tRNA-specific 2-thiouridylase